MDTQEIPKEIDAGFKKCRLVMVSQEDSMGRWDGMNWANVQDGFWVVHYGSKHAIYEEVA